MSPVLHAGCLALAHRHDSRRERGLGQGCEILDRASGDRADRIGPQRRFRAAVTKRPEIFRRPIGFRRKNFHSAKIRGDYFTSRDDKGTNVSQAGNLIVGGDGSLSSFVLPSADEREGYGVDTSLHLGPFDVVGEYLDERIRPRTVAGSGVHGFRCSRLLHRWRLLRRAQETPACG